MLMILGLEIHLPSWDPLEMQSGKDIGCPDSKTPTGYGFRAESLPH